VVLDDLLQNVPDLGRTRSTMRFALLMLWAKPFSTSCRMTKA
jgi:hypothetical protein